MDAVEEILAGIDPRQLAAALGTDEGTAMGAAAATIPTLLSSLQANSASGDGAESLLAAIGQHADSAYGDRIDLAAVDTDDGRKIVAHALADDPQRLQSVSGLGGGLLSKLLPLLAPIVMSYLARKLGSGGPTGSRTGSGNILGDLLGGLLGGAGDSGEVPGQAPGGPGAPAGADRPPVGSGSGPVFNPPDRSGGLQIPIEDEGPGPEQPQQPRSGDPLGDLLGQILGR